MKYEPLGFTTRIFFFCGLAFSNLRPNLLFIDITVLYLRSGLSLKDNVSVMVVFHVLSPT